MLRLAWYRHGDDARLQSQVPGGKGAAVWGSLGRPSRSPGLWNQSPGFDWLFPLPAMIDIKLSCRNSTTSPRKCARAVENSFARSRAQGTPGACCTRGLACKVHKEMRTRAYRYSRSIPASLRNGFTAYAVLSPATNSSCHRHRRISGFVEPGWVDQNLRRLDTSNGCQDHTVLPYVAASFVCMNSNAHGKPALRFRFTLDAPASTASHPNVRDDGQRPSGG